MFVSKRFTGFFFLFSFSRERIEPGNEVYCFLCLLT